MAGFGLACTVSAADYKYLAGEGYRWVTINGPYACSTEQVLKRIITHHTDATELEMVEDGGAYFLIPGAIGHKLTNLSISAQELEDLDL